jgi:hypothetical protein
MTYPTTGCSSTSFPGQKSCESLLPHNPHSAPGAALTDNFQEDIFEHFHDPEAFLVRAGLLRDE